MSEITFEFACRDDCLDKMEPSDLRAVVAERDDLRLKVQGLEQQHHRDSAELRRLCAERDQAISGGNYWKAEKLAADAVIAELEQRLAAQPTAVADAIGCAIEIVRRARDSICAGGFAENRQHEESVVGPYLDGIEDELRELLTAPPAQALKKEAE